jgi:hypothetical protein
MQPLFLTVGGAWAQNGHSRAALSGNSMYTSSRNQVSSCHRRAQEATDFRRHAVLNSAFDRVPHRSSLPHTLSFSRFPRIPFRGIRVRERLEALVDDLPGVEDARSAAGRYWRFASPDADPVKHEQRRLRKVVGVRNLVRGQKDLVSGRGCPFVAVRTRMVIAVRPPRAAGGDDASRSRSGSAPRPPA